MIGEQLCQSQVAQDRYEVLSGPECGETPQSRLLGVLHRLAGRLLDSMFNPLVVHVADQAVVVMAPVALDMGELMAVQEILGRSEIAATNCGSPAVGRTGALDEEGKNHNVESIGGTPVRFRSLVAF